MLASAQTKAAVRQLARDRTSGSGELALRACGILERFVAGRSRSANATVGTAERCGQLARAVASAQPSMAAVLNVSNRWLCAVEQGAPPAATARRLTRELRQAQKTAAMRAARLVADGVTVATYSASSTVLATLLGCRRAGRRFRVLCSESRPRREGLQLAGRLAEAGVPVEMHTDAGLFSALADADLAPDLVLVGCDAILPGCFVNKAGTGALLAAARRSRIPSYVVADSFKFLPKGLAPWFRIRPQSPAEVWRVTRRAPQNAPRKNITVRNFYFEKIPLRACTAVVTESGLWTPNKISALLKRAEIATGLKQPQPFPH